VPLGGTAAANHKHTKGWRNSKQFFQNNKFNSSKFLSAIPTDYKLNIQKYD
jgi:hypothetical protein